MRTIKKVLSNLHRYVLWLLVSIFLWAFVFNAAKVVPAGKKVVVFADVKINDIGALTNELEKELPSGITLVEVHEFSSAIFDGTVIGQADILILPEAEVEKYMGSLSVVPDADPETAYLKDGKAFGVRIFSANSNTGSALKYFGFSNGTSSDYYICFNTASGHTGKLNGSEDDAAISVAESILALP